MANGLCFPTILVAEREDEVRNPLVRHLEHQGYFVLVAHDKTEALRITRVHSRPIQLLLAAESTDGRALADELKRYRPNMHVLFITKAAHSDLEGGTARMDNVRKCVQPPSDT